MKGGLLADRDRKLEELILYIARESQEDRRCGATKLNKLLFYADFVAYHRLGRSITGQKYQKLERGPAPRRVVPVVDSMVDRGLCAWAERSYFDFPLKKLLALREPEVSVFSAAELDIARTVITELWDLNATEVSDLSHRFVGWQAVQIGDEIPYETVFVDEPRSLTQEEEAWALQAIEDYLEQERTA
jgi:hypothetical protein